MKKIITLPLALCCVLAKDAFAADEIHWTITGPSSVTINWHGSASESTLSYGINTGTETTTAATQPTPMPYSADGTFWEAHLTGLQADTLYYYSINNAAMSSFRTPPQSGAANFSLFAEGIMGDSRHYSNMSAVQNLIATNKPNFVLALGDLSVGALNGQASVHQHFNDVMPWSKNAAYMPAWGDYDVRTTSTDNFGNYKGRFDLPNPQTSSNATFAGGEDWSWFDYGNTRFIALPEPSDGAWVDWQTKVNTLMAQAQAAANIKFIVTYGHRPAYSSGHYAGSNNLKSILDTLGDTYSKYVLNLNAHSADYERSHPQHGVTHITVGTGGKNLMQDGGCLWLTCTQPEWSAYRAMHLGALKLSFTATEIKGSFLCGPPGSGINDVECALGSELDSFAINASPDAPTTDSSTDSSIPLTSGSTPLSAAAISSATCPRIALSTSTLILDGGYGYRINKAFGTPADTNTYRTRSKLHLFENGVEIGPAHSLHYKVRDIGQGRFAHWSYENGTGESLRFSATNNSNPNTNGKTYTYCIEGSATGTGDTQAPAAPTSFKATTISTSQINLSWTKPTDNVGVTGYKIYRNGVLLTTTSSTSYANTGLTAGTTYSYYVVAYDAAGNVSAKSTTVSAKTTSATATAPAATSCAPAPTSSLVVNVKDKGATGNGSSNDTAAIQAAIDQVGGTGGTVYVPDGTYMVDAVVGRRLKFKSNMTFRMSSGTVLKTIGNDQAVSMLLHIWSGNSIISNVNIIGGTLEGERYRHSGTAGEQGTNVFVAAANKIFIENVKSRNAWGDGFYVGYNSTNVALCSVLAESNRRHNITITSGNGIIVKDSVSRDADGRTYSTGIDLEPNNGEHLNNVQVLDSQFLGNRSSGIQAGLTTAVIASGGSMTNILIQGNTIASNGVTTDGTNYVGLNFTGQKGSKILNNVIKGNIHGGLSLVYVTANNVVSGNTIINNGGAHSASENKGYGIIVYGSGSTGNSITNNTISDNTINFRDFVGGNTFSGNTVN